MTEPLQVVKTLLSGNWDNSNTTNRTPLIDNIWDAKAPDVANNQDYVLLYEAAHVDIRPGLNLDFKDENWLISCEIRSATRDQLIRIQTEIIRIFDANVRTPGSGYSWLEPAGRKDTVQDKNKPLYIMVQDVKLYKLTTHVG